MGCSRSPRDRLVRAGHPAADAGAGARWISLFLLFLIPVLGAAREEYTGHFPPRGPPRDRDRRHADRGIARRDLLRAHPAGRAPTRATSLSAGMFAIVAAALFAAFGALALWVPSPAHLLQWLVAHRRRRLRRSSSAGSGRAARSTRTSPGSSIVFMLGRAVAGRDRSRCFPRRADPGPTSAARIWPARSSRACPWPRRARRSSSSRRSTTHAGSPRCQSAVDHRRARDRAWRRGSSRTRSAARRRTREAEHALGEKERALAEADIALERVRETNETLRQSEEHLRLVFEAAVDGIVELDHRDVILRANDAFCGMVRIDRDVDRGTAVDGARRVGRRAPTRPSPPSRRPGRARSSGPRASRSTWSRACPKCR